MRQTLPHDYYYGSESEQYIFYRFPKVLFTNNHYRIISDGAKILYGLMLDRMGLSIKNGWLDQQGRVFIFFTLEDLQEFMNCGHNKGVKLLSELDRIGLIERIKQGQGKPTKIYVKKFISDPNPGEYPIETKSYPQSYAQGIQDFRKTEIQTSDNEKSRFPTMGSADFPKADTNKNNSSKPDISENDLIQSYPTNENNSTLKNGWDMDEIKETQLYKELIKKNIEYEILVDQYGPNRVQAIVSLMLDVIRSKKQYITISGDDFSKNTVKSRFLKLNRSHVQYVFDCMDKNSTQIRNIKKYMLSALYNAPTTIDSYYRAEMNHLYNDY